MSKNAVVSFDGDVFAKQSVKMIEHDSWYKFLIVKKCSLQQSAEIRRNPQKYPIKNPKQKHAGGYMAINGIQRTHLTEPQGKIRNPFKQLLVSIG